VEQAVRTLLAAAPPGSKVILFGSRARGQARPDSDVDFMVVEPEVKDPFDESDRLSALLAPLEIAFDVVVTSSEQFEYWRDTPNTVYGRAKREGKVYG
jgi:predicted nucleotidyltransferase